MLKVLKIIGVILLLLLVVAVAISIKPDLSKEDLKQYWQAPSQFITLPDSGATIHYRDQGNPDGPVLVMVHGQFGSLYNWEAWIPFLKDDYRLISLDTPGQGLTGRIPGDFYSRGNMAEILGEFITALDLGRKVTLVGNSAGGDISLYYTIHYPEHVEGLVLIGSGGTTTWEDWQERLLEFAVADDIISKMERTYNGGMKDVRTIPWFDEVMLYFQPPGVVRLGLEYMMADDSKITDEMVAQSADLIRYEGNRFAQELMTYHGYAEVGHQDLIPFLPQIKVPTLLMWGTEDYIIPVSEAHEFDQLIEDTQLIIYDNVGHLSQMEIPERSARDLDAFMKTKVIPAAKNFTEEQSE